MSIKRYQKNKQTFGTFWGLYLIGISTVFDVKYSIGKLLLSFCLQYVISYYTNIITLNTVELGDKILAVIVIICVVRIVHNIISYYIEKNTLIEHLKISQKITNYVNELYFTAPQAWKNKNGNASQKESLQHIFFSYNNITSSIINTLSAMIDAVIILLIAFNNDWFICVIIMVSSYTMFKIKKRLNTELSELNKKMGTKMNEASLINSNQFTNRADLRYSLNYKDILTTEQYDPVCGFLQTEQMWNNRNALAYRSNAIINTMRNVIIAILCAYLYYIEKPELIIFVVINNYTLFGFVNIVIGLEEIQNMSGGRLASSFKMIDDLVDVNTNYNYFEIKEIKNSVNIVVSRKIKKIVINNIEKAITEDINLKYSGKLVIKFKKGIISLEGPKGCGKSVTMDIIAGLYDDCITDGVYADDIRLPNEFRDLAGSRGYVTQCVADNYKFNKKNTVCMTLKELFPNGTYDEIRDFLEHFDMTHKIPNNLVTAVSTEERGLSPGETQSIVVASQLWKSMQVGASFLLLDEIERNIDFATVKKIFAKILDMFDGPILLITHLPDLKVYLEEHIREVWKYKQNDGGELSFVVESK